jgi:ABC-type methionine transport system ATPase subunit
VRSALLSLEGVSLHYGRGRRHVVRVLADVSLEVGAEEVVCVWAQRGRGKTTLMRVAAGMQRPSSGRVTLDGHDLWGLSDRHRTRLLAKEIGWVTANRPELDVPVLNHVAMPLLVVWGSGRAYARAREALKRAGVSDCAGQRWASLSDEERARVGVARAIAEEPRLLVVDDLTAMLRREETDGVIQLLRSVAGDRGVGVLASVSSMGETKWSDRIATLSDGELLVSAREPKDRPEKVVAGPWPAATAGGIGEPGRA